MMGNVQLRDIGCYSFCKDVKRKRQTVSLGMLGNVQLRDVGCYTSFRDSYHRLLRDIRKRRIHRGLQGCWVMFSLETLGVITFVKIVTLETRCKGFQGTDCVYPI